MDNETGKQRLHAERGRGTAEHIMAPDGFIALFDVHGVSCLVAVKAIDAVVCERETFVDGVHMDAHAAIVIKGQREDDLHVMGSVANVAAAIRAAQTRDKASPALPHGWPRPMLRLWYDGDRTRGGYVHADGTSDDPPPVREWLDMPPKFMIRRDTSGEIIEALYVYASKEPRPPALQEARRLDREMKGKAANASDAGAYVEVPTDQRAIQTMAAEHETMKIALRFIARNLATDRAVRHARETLDKLGIGWI